MQKDEAIRKTIQAEIDNLGLGEAGSKRYSLDELSNKAPVLTREILLATAHVNNVTDNDKLIDPPHAVEFNVQQGRAGKFGMGYDGTLRFDVDHFKIIDMPELRVITQHELGHYAEFMSRPKNYQQPSIKDPSDPSQLEALRSYYYSKEFQADWYADALTGVYSHLKAVQRKPESYEPIEKSPDHPDRKSRITAMISELYVVGLGKNDMPQSGNISDIVLNRVKSSPEVNERIASKVRLLDNLVRDGLTDASIDLFVSSLEDTSEQIPKIHTDANGLLKAEEKQRRIALASSYMLDPAKLGSMAEQDDASLLYAQRQELLNWVATEPYSDYDKLRLQVAIEGRFDVSAYKQIIRNEVQKLEAPDSEIGV